MKGYCSKVTEKRSIYFVATELGEVHHGPAVYTRALWDLFRDSDEFDFHLVVLKSDVKHPRIHTPLTESGQRRGFYQRVASHILNTVPGNDPNVILHVNSAHLISGSIAAEYKTIVQINDTEVCQHRISLARTKQYGARRMIALQWRKHREKTVAKNSALVIGNSDFTTKTVRDRYNLTDRDVTRIYKAVPIAPFLDAYPQTSAPNQLRLVFIGNNWQRKGLSVLIKAVGILNRSDNGVSVNLEVYGHPSTAELNHFRNLSIEVDAASQVQFVGTLQRADAPAVLSKCDMLVLPSFEEALGLVTIESIATGIPVVGSQVGGIPEVINHPNLGRLAQPGNSEDLAAAILAEYQTDDSKEKIRFRKESSKRFDTQTLKRNITALYERLFSSPSNL